jgi:hypothetical protein
MTEQPAVLSLVMAPASKVANARPSTDENSRMTKENCPLIVV